MRRRTFGVIVTIWKFDRDSRPLEIYVDLEGRRAWRQLALSREEWRKLNAASS